jgi:FkbM family methyltransferase
MKTKIINFLKKIKLLLPKPAKKFCYYIGYHLGESPHKFYPDLINSLINLKQIGFNPINIIDIGAYHGEWTAMIKRIFPESNVLMIEAQESKDNILKDISQQYSPSVFYEIVLLSSEDEQEVRFVEMETGSSVFEESSPYERDYISKKTVTLDTLLKIHPDFQCADFLKIDVQGYELEVLRGAKKLLEKVELVLMEVSLIPVNKGCPIMSEVIAFMADYDFRVLDFCSQIRRSDGFLWQTDLLFIKNHSRYLPRTTLDKDNWVNQ